MGLLSKPLRRAFSEVGDQAAASLLERGAHGGALGALGGGAAGAAGMDGNYAPGAVTGAAAGGAVGGALGLRRAIQIIFQELKRQRPDLPDEAAMRQAAKIAQDMEGRM